MKEFPVSWWLPRRDPDEKIDPVELLFDITFVLAMTQAASLMRHTPGLAGVSQAVVMMMILFYLWHHEVMTSAVATVTAPVMKLFNVLQTGMMLALAVTVPAAFDPWSGWTWGPGLFAATLTVSCAVGAVMNGLAWIGAPHLYRNAALIWLAAAFLAAGTWLSVPAEGTAKIWIMYGTYLAATTVHWSTCLPTYDRIGIGIAPDWQIYGIRVFCDRFDTAYLVACCLALELLEQAGQPARISVPLIALTAFGLGLAYLFYRLGVPISGPARRGMDPRTSTLSLGRSLFLLFSMDFGNSLMASGLVVAANAMRQSVVEIIASDGGAWLGPSAGMNLVAELFGGATVCLLGQAMVWFAGTWRVDWLRVGAAVGFVLAIPLLTGLPALIPVAVMVSGCGLLLVLDSRRARRKVARASAAVRAGLDAARARAKVISPRWRSWRPALRFTGSGHELSTFELLFDIIAAFTFAQIDVLVLTDPTMEGAMRGLLILAVLWGCWVTFVWAANNTDADAGTTRTLHITAILGMVFLGMTMPRAFTQEGLSHRVLLFLAAYLIVRAASAALLWSVKGHTAGMRPVLIVGAAIVTAALIAWSTQVPQEHRIPIWVAGLACELAAAILYMRGWRITAPGHLGERFSFIVLLGLDMSLAGVGTQLNGSTVALPELALIALALVTCTVMWWFYFDLLAPYADHRLTHTHANGTRLAHLFYDLIHFAALAGTIAFGLGLRSIARDLGTTHSHPFGPPITPLVATALGAGLATYLAAIAGMWKQLGRTPRLTTPALIALSLAVIPILTGQPALAGLTLIVTLALTAILAEALNPTARTQRHTLRAELTHQPTRTIEQHPPAAVPVRPHISTTDVDRQFDLLDVNHDGIITWTDFTHLLHRIDTDPVCRRRELGPRAEAAYRQLWNNMRDAMDHNNDHAITRHEYRTYFTSNPTTDASAEQTAPSDTTTLANLIHTHLTHLEHARN
ncbi:low temperature requirement protein A [Streptomyces sp. NPDC001941]|uniref:low temperature requirement protein A n=1 Tax=Streptomyces sp. NPDC001941 TaxID=3154659 RepID=UPI0033262F59